VHEALARVRKRSELVEIAQPESMEGRLKTESTAPSPKQEGLNDTMRIVLERAVDRLPESYRSVFMLRELEGMTTAEPVECPDLGEESVKGPSLLRVHCCARGRSAAPALFLGKLDFTHTACAELPYDSVVKALLPRLMIKREIPEEPLAASS
jgi:RNA polymerase sigma-70 factor (ECF subfamily)